MINTKKIVVPIFIIALMVFSVLGFAIYGLGPSGSPELSAEYKGIDFRFDKTSNQWVGFKDKDKISFYNNPEELAAINLDINLLQKISQSNKIYLSYNPQDGLQNSINFLRANLAAFFQKQISIACKEDQEGCEELPLKTCEDSKQDIIIFEISLSEQKENSLSNNCLKIHGDEDYIVKITEKIRMDLIL